MKQIELLGDDLSYIFENFRPNPIQVKKYPKPKRGKRLTHTMMSKDHPKALRLYLREDEAGELVGSLKKSSAERFWQYNDSTHVFAPVADLIRLGVFCHLDFYHGIALGLKGLWERFYAKESKSSGGSLVEMLTDYDKARAVSEKFEPTCAELYELVNRYKRYEQAWEEELRYYTEANFCSLVQEMLLAELHLVGQDSNELAFFAENKREEMRLLAEGSEQEQTDFWIKKCIWVQKQEDLGGVLMQIERERLRNAEIERRWLVEFGKEYLEIERYKFEISMLELQIQLKKAEPGLSLDEIKVRIQKEQEEMSKHIKALEIEVEMAALLEKEANGGVAIDPDTLMDYEKEYKKLLRELYFLLHTDKLEHRPEYENLTQEQKELLKKLLQEVLEIKDEKKGFKEPYLAASMRSLERLRQIKEHALAILEMAGVDIKTELVIKGETIKERIAWLDKEILRLESAIDEAKKELLWIMKDEEIARKKAMLEADENKQKEIKKEMQGEREKLEKQVRALEKELSKLCNQKKK